MLGFNTIIQSFTSLITDGLMSDLTVAVVGVLSIGLIVFGFEIIKVLLLGSGLERAEKELFDLQLWAGNRVDVEKDLFKREYKRKLSAFEKKWGD